MGAPSDSPLQDWRIGILIVLFLHRRHRSELPVTILCWSQLRGQNGITDQPMIGIIGQIANILWVSDKWPRVRTMCKSYTSERPRGRSTSTILIF